MKNNANQSRLKASFWVLLCVALWALIPVVSKLGQESLDNHQFLFWSSMVSFGTLITAAGARGRLREIRELRPQEFLKLGILGLLGTYIYYLFLYLGYARAEGMEVLVIQYTWPFFIVILSAPLLGEHLTIKNIAAALLGFSGVLLVLSKGSFGSVRLSDGRTIALVLLGAFCFALFSVLGKKISIDPLIATAVYFFAAMIASGVSMLVFSGWKVPLRSELLPILLNGILVNGVSYLFWFFALRAGSASYVAPFVYLTPVVSAVYLILLFKQPFIPVYAAGIGLVLAGGLLNSIGNG